MSAALHVPAWQTAVLLAFAAVVAIFGALYTTARPTTTLNEHDAGDDAPDLVPRHMLDDALADNARLRVKAEMMQLGWLAALADVEALRAQRSFRETIYGPVRRGGVAS